MRETGRPVGPARLARPPRVGHGRVPATADPRLTDDFKVLQVIVMDPLYPYGSTVWGRSPRPREAISVSRLGRQFVPRSTRNFQAGGGTSAASSWSQSLSGKYVIVMPYTPTTVPLRHRA